ncbi:transposase [Siminovitchia terrae]|uniref:transposase n=1 Tax=Siminovitchia terrae TaxID=1914933 RepID=UPI001BB30A48|nr:transposase [Siminovitchia terrae]
MLGKKQTSEYALPIYEKGLVHKLPESVEILFKESPIDPKWSVKKNSDGKTGYKAHLAVSTKRQYILAGMKTSGNLNDGKAVIPLLKKIKRDLSDLFTAGYLMPAMILIQSISNWWIRAYRLSSRIIAETRGKSSALMRTSRRHAFWRTPIATTASIQSTKL